MFSIKEFSVGWTIRVIRLLLTMTIHSNPEWLPEDLCGHLATDTALSCFGENAWTFHIQSLSTTMTWTGICLLWRLCSGSRKPNRWITKLLIHLMLVAGLQLDPGLPDGQNADGAYRRCHLMLPRDVCWAPCCTPCLPMTVWPHTAPTHHPICSRHHHHPLHIRWRWVWLHSRGESPLVMVLGQQPVWQPGMAVAMLWTTYPQSVVRSPWASPGLNCHPFRTSTYSAVGKWPSGSWPSQPHTLHAPAISTGASRPTSADSLTVSTNNPSGYWTPTHLHTYHNNKL